MTSHTKKGLLLVADGMADRPCAALEGKTPLEAARRPNLDRLAVEGECGLMDVVAPGIRCGSDTGHLALLGYDPRLVYTGRGPFEALGIGMEVLGGDIALRCNFSTVSPDMVVTDRRAGRIQDGTQRLAAAVNGVEIDGVTCYFKESVAHRGALVLRGAGLSPHVTDTDPHVEGVVVQAACAVDGSDAATRTAEVINQFVKLSYERLRNDPLNQAREAEGLPAANVILPRGAGEAPRLPDFNRLNNVTSACVVETGLIRGIARFVGMEPVEASGATGGTDSDVSAIGRAILTAFRSHDFVLCNVKGPDLCGHDNNPPLKRDLIEKVDAMVGQIVAEMGSDLILAVTADHSTPCEVGDHTGDPVPLLIWGAGQRGDEVSQFHERSVHGGALGRRLGRDLVPMLTNLMLVQEKFGA